MRNIHLLAVLIMVFGGLGIFRVNETAAASDGSALAVSAGPQDNLADQVRQLRDLVKKQQEQINQLSQTNSASGSTTITNDQRQEILALIKEEMKDQVLPDWVNNLKVVGDFRFRTQWTEKANTEKNEISGTAQSREETLQAIRARLGFFEQVNPDVSVGIQLITGGGTKGYGGADPISGNQTLGGGGYPGEEKEPVWFDLAYADYHPKAVPGLDFFAGRMPNPFLEPGNSELIWSSDLRMDGMVAQYKKQVGEGLTLFGNAGGFWITEGVDNGGSGGTGSGTADPDAMLWAAQGYATLALPQLAPGAYATGGASIYAYTHMQNVVNESGSSFPAGGPTSSPGLPLPSGTGNSTNPNGTLFSGFDIFNPFFEVGVDDPWLHKRFAVFGDFAYNAAARQHLIGGVNVHDDNNAFAWLIGTSYGTLRKPGDWQVMYNYRRVGADAVVAMFDDSNAGGGGGTDYYGSKFTLAYQVAKGWQASLNYYYDDVTNQDIFRESPSYQRLQLDLIFCF